MEIDLNNQFQKQKTEEAALIYADWLIEFEQEKPDTEKLNQFKLEEVDRIKPNDEIKKIIEHSHRILARDHIREYLDDQQNSS